MANKLPKFLDNHKICIICEGNEEQEYLKRLKDLKVWNEQYDISLVNAGGNGNIPARYQDRYQNGADELVLVFCDTEKKPHEQYEDIKRKINEFHGGGNAADEVIMFGNPCTMQIISKHWTDENLKSPAKPVNAPLIKEYTGGRITKEEQTRFEKLWNMLLRRIMWICASGLAIWSRMIRLPAAVISESLQSCLRVVTVAGLRR